MNGADGNSAGRGRLSKCGGRSFPKGRWIIPFANPSKHCRCRPANKLVCNCELRIARAISEEQVLKCFAGILINVG